MKESTIYGHYEKLVDRESAHEMLKSRAPQLEQPSAKTAGSSWQAEAGGLFDAMGKSAARAIGSQVGREIIRGVLGSLKMLQDEQVQKAQKKLMQAGVDPGRLAERLVLLEHRHRAADHHPVGGGIEPRDSVTRAEPQRAVIVALDGTSDIATTAATSRRRLPAAR